MAKIEVNAVFVDIFHQWWHIGCTAEQHWARVAKRHIHVFQFPRLHPVITRQIHRFLRGACTFDRHPGLGENRVFARHFLNQFPCIRGEIITVIRGHAVLSKRVVQALNGIPIQLEPGRDDQRGIANDRAVP